MAQINNVNINYPIPRSIHLQPRQFKNKDAIENLIRYITRTRPNEDRRAELITYGAPSGCPCYKSPEQLINEFKYISKSSYTKGSLALHYTVLISDYAFNRMNNSMDRLAQCMVECCQYIFLNLGHQCCFAIHYSQKKKLHVHIAINATNYRTGRKFNQYPKAIKSSLEWPLEQIITRYTYIHCDLSLLDLLDSDE